MGVLDPYHPILNPEVWRRWRPSPCCNTCTARTAPEQFCCSYQIILKLRCPGQPIGARMKPERSGSPVLAHVTMFVQFFLLISDDWQNFDFPWLSTFFFQKSKKLLRQLRKWHKYKMASKVARPAAQLQELFKFHNVRSSGSLASQGKETKFAGGKGSKSLKAFELG